MRDEKKVELAQATSLSIISSARESTKALKNTQSNSNNAEDSEDEFTSSRTYSFSGTISRFDTMKSNPKLQITGDPKYWNYNQVKIWLDKHNLNEFKTVFERYHVFNEEYREAGIDGELLLSLTPDMLTDPTGDFRILSSDGDKVQGSGYFSNKKLDDLDKDDVYKRFFTELTKLKLGTFLFIIYITRIRNLIKTFMQLCLYWNIVLHIHH